MLDIPQLRYCAFTGDPVIVAPARAARPGTERRRPHRERAPRYDPTCPFCPGNEHECARQLFRFPTEPPSGERGQGEPWRIRVVANKYPALVSPAAAADLQASGPTVAEAALGRHEVIIETPRHDLRLVEFDVTSIAEILDVYRQRFAAAASDPRTRYIVIFRNEGPLANASIPHPHSQLAALDFLPPRISRLLDRSRHGFALAGEPTLLELLRAEVETKERIVRAGDGFVTLVPFAATHEYEIWIVPRQLPGRFDRSDDQQLVSLAAALRTALRALDAALGDPDYNLLLHTPPLIDGAESILPWYIQIIPRLTLAAGFELGLGVQICTISPEEAAARLREGHATVAGS